MLQCCNLQPLNITVSVMLYLCTLHTMSLTQLLFDMCIIKCEYDFKTGGGIQNAIIDHVFRSII